MTDEDRPGMGATLPPWVPDDNPVKAYVEKLERRKPWYNPTPAERLRSELTEFAKDLGVELEEITYFADDGYVWALLRDACETGSAGTREKTITIVVDVNDRHNWKLIYHHTETSWRLW